MRRRIASLYTSNQPKRWPPTTNQLSGVMGDYVNSYTLASEPANQPASQPGSQRLHAGDGMPSCLPSDFAERQSNVGELLLEGLVHVLLEVRGFHVLDYRGLKERAGKKEETFMGGGHKGGPWALPPTPPPLAAAVR